MVKALELRQVGLRYAARSAMVLEDVDLDVARGEIVAVIGPNGAGKSSLLRVAAGLVTPSRGTAHAVGEDLTRLRPLERARRVAMVPQGLEAIPPFRVRAFVEGGRYAHRHGTPADLERAVVQSALERTAMTAFADRALETLSGGERQRVLVARALAQDTPILLGDEPTASLDPGHQIAILELFADAARDGRAVLLVTHDLNLAAQFAQRIVALDRGHIVAQGTPAEILRAEVLGAVFGPHLHFGRLPGTDASPLVVPRRRERSDG
ncbi:MAG: ABC transporter ATP-binding protein [Planctomycetota bacterium]